MDITLIRDGDPQQAHNYGQMFINGQYFGETLEDKDRYLESGGEKVYGSTCIPRGRYQISVRMSAHFGREMPHIEGVPGFSEIMVHGGNREEDTLGCVLLGAVRVPEGIANCHGVNERLLGIVADALNNGEEVWIDIS